MEAFSRSKSFSQAASASNPSLPPTRVGAATPALSSTSPQPQQNVVKNILKSVESHVRIMSAVERTATSSNCTSIRLQKPDSDGGASAASSPDQKGSSSSQPSSQSTANAGGGVGGSGSGRWSESFNVTRVHRGGATNRFYEEVVAPCVSNCTSGQSYVFLVNGPPESGRSQTLYGSPHHNELGLVELAAADLLERMSSSGKVIMRNHRDGGGNKENDLSKAQSNNANSNNNNGREDGSEVTMTGGITVTYAAFTTRGARMVETETSEPVPLVEFPPPLGYVPLPQMRLLEDASRAVLLPERKHVDTSCVIQFHVYAPVDSTGRRSMATLTFVDVAAIREPLCKEVAHLIETVERVAGVASSGGDPNFKETKLTTLLEPALVGYVTLVSITTLSGRPDLYDSSCTALRFASNISRIHQVLMLTHINAPRWIFDTGVSLEQLRMQRDQLMAEHYQRGVYDYYETATRWLRQNVGDIDGSVQHLLDETAVVRKDVAREVEEQSKELQASIAAEEANCRAEVEAARAAYDATSHQFEEVRRLDEAIAALQQRLSQTDMQSAQRISEMRLEISALEAKANNQRQQLQQIEKEMKLYVLKTNEVSETLSKYAEEARYGQGTYAMAHELTDLGRKRRRLESDLELASRVAQRTTDTMRVDRERRSRISRLSAMQQRVQSLRETVQSSTSNLPCSQQPQQPPQRTASAASRSGQRR
ncbi:hypothetical protein ABB37_01904 [Leptomonas pyrrhocoris]|uniref:Kinesin motor domain-containing protein n=1 Tax=Leptomonas pyrrhocoris TaxID=157538 RepID=A0A0M9G711_LEPPY|nr:hypothetical protein ABB37_01904 [Leptomonas pyrrhocoris]KPA83636.1 hypothetical protein ABB37_01904 [Leptomonas pyrrhocoris]|eukprot:XP_015662075.1 hypothetical protein ABB37_01904 [Leptomonas pyrrhocoris]